MASKCGGFQFEDRVGKRVPQPRKSVRGKTRTDWLGLDLKTEAHGMGEGVMVIS